jgi:hypothetical protein
MHFGAIWRGTRFVRVAAALIAIAALVGGCAIDNAGFLASHVTSAEGAWVVDVYSLGAYLHTRADDPGLQFGAGRRSYVFEKTENNKLTPGWHYFVADLLDARAYAIDTRVIGVDTAFSRNDAGITIGLHGTTTIAQVNEAESLCYRLTYRPEQPERTQLQISEDPTGDAPCAFKP